MKFKFIALIAALFLGWTGVQAQEYDYKPYPYNFAGVQAGAQMMLLNYDHLKLITPIGGAYFGSMLSPYYGIRLSAQGAWSKMGFKPMDEALDYKYVTGSFDVLFNVSNLFTKNLYHRFHTFIIGGVGMTYAWDFDNVPLMATKPWNERRYTTNWRVGVMEEMNLSKHLAVNLEVDLNNLNDRLIGPVKGRNDWQLVGMLGLTYKFGLKKNYKKTQPAAQTTPAVAVQPAARPQQPVPTAAKVVKKAPEKAFVAEKNEIDVFFNLGKSSITPESEAKIKALGEWLKTRSNTKVVVTGYADKGTGTAEGNEKVSKARAESVAKELVEKYGFDANQIVVDYKGDTVQPYDENDLNRLARIQAETFKK